MSVINRVSCGRGRGRRREIGLNTPLPKPGGPFITTKINERSAATTDTVVASYYHSSSNCDHQETFDPMDEVLSVNFGDIKFDRQLQSVYAHFTKCESKEKVEKRFGDLFKACLPDPEKSAKLAVLVYTLSFPLQEIYATNLRNLFLNNLQTHFEDRHNLRKTNPAMFRNFVLMIGRFIKNGRMENEASYDFLIPSFISCLDMLMEQGATQDDVMYFTAELYLNADRSFEKYPAEMRSLLNKARLLLVTEASLTESAKYWLMTVIQLPVYKCDVLFSHLSQYVW